MTAIRKLTTVRTEQATQPKTKRSLLLSEPYPQAFQQLLDGVVAGEGLPASLLKQIEENAKMLEKWEMADETNDIGLKVPIGPA